jgi:short-subunit dehydrogenase
MSPSTHPAHTSISRHHALVTGASSGIGMEIARQLAARGYSLVLVARRADRLEALSVELIAQHKVGVVVLAQDLAAPDAAPTIMAKLAAMDIELEILVNNAGYGMQGKFLEMDMADIEQMFRLNMSALTHLTQLCARAMAQRKQGYILNVASAAAFLPSPYVSAYAATKAYVMSFSEALRYELKGSGVSVTTLYPGITTTEFNAVAEAKHPPLMNRSILSAAQVARIGLRAMFKRRRSIVPGLINKFNAFFSQVWHRGMITATAGHLLKKANGQ